MATILDKDILRESTVQIDGREIQVTLTADQQISFKLKGMKSGVLSISIEALYNQLAGLGEAAETVEAPKEKYKPKKKFDGEPTISLYALRSNVLVTKMEWASKMELEKVVCELIKQEIKLFENG